MTHVKQNQILILTNQIHTKNIKTLQTFLLLKSSSQAIAPQQVSLIQISANYF